MAKSTNKDALKIARQIVELEAQIEPLKNRLATLQRQFSAIISGNDAFDSEASSTNSEATPNITELLKNIFRNAPESVFTVSDLQQALPANTPQSTIRSTISRLANQKNGVQQVSRGHYQYFGGDNNYDDFFFEESSIPF